MQEYEAQSTDTDKKAGESSPTDAFHEDLAGKTSYGPALRNVASRCAQTTHCVGCSAIANYDPNDAMSPDDAPAEARFHQIANALEDKVRRVVEHEATTIMTAWGSLPEAPRQCIDATIVTVLDTMAPVYRDLILRNEADRTGCLEPSRSEAFFYPPLDIVALGASARSGKPPGLQQTGNGYSQLNEVSRILSAKYPFRRITCDSELSDHERGWRGLPPRIVGESMEGVTSSKRSADEDHAMEPKSKRAFNRY